MNICFLDMDGVIVNFPFTPSYLKSMGTGCPPGELAKDWGTIEFWVGLPKFSWSDELVKVCRQQFTHVHFLTSTAAGAASLTGKRRWLDHHYPELASRTVFTQEKYLLGAPGRVLIDDDPWNCRTFEGAGGQAIHFDGNASAVIAQIARLQ